MGYVVCILLEGDEGCASLDFCFASQNVGNAGKQESNRDASNERHTHTMCYRESKGEHMLRYFILLANKRGLTGLFWMEDAVQIRNVSQA